MHELDDDMDDNECTDIDDEVVDDDNIHDAEKIDDEMVRQHD